MAQTKIYPSTQAQVQAVQSTVDEINSKIVTPHYQVKTVTPSNIQQTVQADSGYTALSGVVVNPIAALMPENLEDFIMRNDQMENFSISVNGSIPDYACYMQKKLVAVYGDLSGTIGGSAFDGCTELQTINTMNVTSIGADVFHHCPSLQTIDTRNITSIGNHAFNSCTSLRTIDMRNATLIGSSAFNSCSNLQLVDCTSCTTPPTIQSNTFQSTNNSFRVVVATNTEKALFQAATNWSARASQIYTVAEIEAIVGMTYDEYYLQIFGHARNEVN